MDALDRQQDADNEQLAVTESLASILRRQQVDALIGQAKTIRDYPGEAERHEAAEILLRHARIELVLRRITEQEERRIYSILRFVVE